MGYHIYQKVSKFRIPVEKKEAALDAVKAMAQVKPKWSWIESHKFWDLPTLEAVFEVWRWEVSNNTRGDIISIEFTGEKLGEDDRFFDVLAPYVDSGSYIEMFGEDGETWRWVFTKGEFYELAAKLIWEET